MRTESYSKERKIGALEGRLSAQSEEVERLRKALHESEQPQPGAATVQKLLQIMQTSELNVKLAQAEEERQEMERQLGALQRHVEYLEHQTQGDPQTATEQQIPTSFEWRRCRNLPIRVAGAKTVVLNGKVYLGDDEHVLEYTPENDEWVVLHNAPVKGFGLDIFNNELVLAGGKELSTYKRTNKITVFNPISYQWVYPYPPMPTARSHPSAIGYQHYLVVAGGRDDDNNSLSKVEVLDSIKAHWYTAAQQLSMRCNFMIPIAVSKTVYLLGGFSDNERRTKAVITLSLPAVTHQPESKENMPASCETMQIPDSPFYRSAPFTANNRLLTTGGATSDSVRVNRSEISSHIYGYDSVTSQWEKVGDLPEPRYWCSCTVLPSSELLVVGGWPNYSSVYKGTIQWKSHNYVNKNKNSDFIFYAKLV